MIELTEEALHEIIELAWAAGFYDGEGCTGSNGKTLYAGIKQIHPYVLERFRAAVGVGYIGGPYKDTSNDGHNRNPQWHYHANAYKDVAQLVTRLWKYLSPVKQRQAALAYRCYHNMSVKHHPSQRINADILTALAKGSKTQAQIAEEFDVSQAYVSTLYRKSSFYKCRRVSSN